MHTFTRLGLLTAMLAGAGGCFNPNITFDLDAGVGFRCFVTDYKPCPEGLSCCDPKSGLCDDALYTKAPNTRGWCTPPSAPSDLQSRAIDLWDFGPKALASAATADPGLTGKDPGSGEWRCPRGPKYINRQEPNDSPTDAISAGKLVVNSVPMTLTNHEICPDEAAPTTPDVDVFRFELTSPSRVYVDTRFSATKGDLDVAIFDDNQMDGQPRPNLVITDGLGTGDNSCLAASNLMTGKYYVVVRGAPNQAGPYNQPGVTYALNAYQIRIAALAASSMTAPPCGAAAGDMR